MSQRHFQVLSATEHAMAWDAYIAQLTYDNRDVHFTSGWGRAHEAPGVTAHLAVLQGESMVCQPFLLRRIEGTPFNDMAWPGYGGPMTNAALPSKMNGIGFDLEFTEWKLAHAVVSEFYLINPVFAALQAVLVPEYAGWQVRERGVTILPAELSQVLKMMRPNRRESMRSGAGALVDWVDPELAQALYDDAMSRKGGSKRWQLSGHIGRLDPARTAIFGASNAGGLKAMAVFIFGTEAAYYYLAARAEDCPAGYSDQLILAGLQLAHERGCTWMHLGGGLSSDTDDSLAAYKRSWGGMIRPTFSVRRIVDELAYQAMSGQIELQPRVGFFPAYRQKETQ